MCIYVCAGYVHVMRAWTNVIYVCMYALNAGMRVMHTHMYMYLYLCAGVVMYANKQILHNTCTYAVCVCNVCNVCDVMWCL